MGTVTTCEPNLPRIRAASDLKYLLNESAALRGKVAALDRSGKSLRQRLAKLDAAAAKVRVLLAALDEERCAHLERLRAHDLVLAHVHPGAADAGVVNAWVGKYGPRGARKAFLLALIRAAGPRGVTNTEATEAVATEFSVALATWHEKTNLQGSVRRQLAREEAAGRLVRRLNDSGTFVWVVQDSTLTMLLSHHEKSDREPDQDGTRAEMGGQRAGGSHG